MNVTQFDFEDKLEITGLVLDETKTYSVDHDATIVEEDGTEVRIAERCSVSECQHLGDG